MCGSLRVTKEQMRNFVLGKKANKMSNNEPSGGPFDNNSIVSNEGSKKRSIDVDSGDGSDNCIQKKVAKSVDETPKNHPLNNHATIEPIEPNPNYSISDRNETRRYIIYMSLREYHPSFSEGLSKCRMACSDQQVQSCLQFDGTRHITMFDGYLTNEQANKLAYKYNRFENGSFNPIKLKIEGWMPWDAGCYLKIKSNSERVLEAILRKIDGFPYPINQMLQKKDLEKQGKVKFPCNHLSLYRCRPSMEISKMKQSFGLIRNAVANHDWGYVEGVGIRIKVMGEPYSDCKVLAGV